MNTVIPAGSPAHAARVAPRTALSPIPPAAASQPTPPPMSVPVVPAYSLKAVLDYTLAVVLFVVLLPFMLLTFVAVKLTSRGPAIYSQTRVGRGGRVFVIYKFRSMYHECEKQTGIQWSVKGDPRITPLGKILRVLHLDELPQLWNVLRGEMSLVGPRPERPEIVEDLRVSVYGYDIRHAVKPGITGFAQVHLPPDSSILTVKNKLIYDRFYVGRMGLLTDLYCLFCTGLKVLGLRRLYHRPPRKQAGE
jgi:lipopolysaccharide/colanic/teichoic acid biosynthesis glycosyltransferase